MTQSTFEKTLILITRNKKRGLFLQTKIVVALILISSLVSFSDKAMCYEGYSRKIRVTSDDLEEGKFSSLSKAHMFDGEGCGGLNQSPHIRWDMDEYGYAKSYAVTMYDPNLPTGTGMWNWIAYNIPAGVNELPRGISKFRSREMDNGYGITAISDYGEFGFIGPCEPKKGDSGEYKYIISVHALDVEKLPVGPYPTNAIVRLSLIKHTLVAGYMVVRNVASKKNMIDGSDDIQDDFEDSFDKEEDSWFFGATEE